MMSINNLFRGFKSMIVALEKHPKFLLRGLDALCFKCEQLFEYAGINACGSSKGPYYINSLDRWNFTEQRDDCPEQRHGPGD